MSHATLDAHTVVALPALTPQACAPWVDAVMALRRYWTARHADAPFFTLGLAAYLDGVQPDPELGGKTPYHIPALMRQNNQLLAQHFQALLSRCEAVIAQWLQQPCRFSPEDTALPGFHIHLPHPVFREEVASHHCDLQFQAVFKTQRPGVPTPAEHPPLTFTLPLSLPPGAGLYRWPEAQRLFVPYRLGEVFIHDGLTPHQAVLHPQGGNTPRVMLQGHAWWRDGAYVLYW